MVVISTRGVSSGTRVVAADEHDVVIDFRLDASLSLLGTGILMIKLSSSAMKCWQLLRLMW